MYQIKCDDSILYDYRDPSLIVANPRVKIEVNTVGDASFTIYQNHPYYGKLKVLKSIFEISDEIGVIFRGRMTENSHDFYNTKAVDLEGLMAFFNDSIVAPYNFPEDFVENEEYITAAESGNVVEFFLKWLIDNHNSQVEDFQKFKLGVVTVSDPNNYVTRSESNFPKTWDVLKSKLFGSDLGGYLCIRYEDDGNYIDYLSEFTLTNTQEITFGENLLDLKNNIDASKTYSAIIPIGAEVEEEIESTNESGATVTEKVKRKVTLADIEDGNITDDIVKCTLPNGLAALYSISAVEKYGWKCSPVADTTWKDVTEVQNLLSKSVEHMTNIAPLLSNPVEFSAADLHFSDAEIRSFRLYRNVKVNSSFHNQSGQFPLISLTLDLLNPQNTKIVVGETRQTLTDYNSQQQSNTIQRIETAEKDIEENRISVSEVKNQVISQSTRIINSAEEIILAALESYVETDVGGTVESVINYYLAAAASTDVTAETEGWTENIPTLTSETCYLWAYEVTSYSDGNSVATQPKLIASYNGSGVSNITEFFAANTNNEKPIFETESTDENGETVTVENELSWDTTIPALSVTNFYLWHYKRILFEDGTTQDTEKNVIGSYKYSYSEFKETVEAQLSILNKEISLKFTDVSEKLDNIDGDLQKSLSTIETFFAFDIDGFTIGKTNSPYKVYIDDNEFTMTVNNIPVLWFELTENRQEANIPELKVTKKFVLLGYLIEEDENGIVNCEYVGGEA